MPYGIIKVDQVTFTNAGADQTISVSGIVASISGNITATGTISGNVIRGGTTVSGATVTGTAGQFGTITGNTAGFTTVTGTTVTGTTATFTSGVFTNISGGTHTITSGVFASGTAANPSIAFQGDVNTGIYSPGADQVAISTGGSGRVFVDSAGRVGIGNSSIGANTGNSVVFIKGSNQAVGTAQGQLAVLTTNSQASDVGASIALGGQSTGADWPYATIAGRSEGNSYAGYFAVGTSTSGGVHSERLRITSAGLVGIGTTAVTNLLHLRSDSSSNVDHLYLQNRNGGANSGARIAFSNGTVDYSDNRYAYIGAINTGATENGNHLVFATNANGAAATEKARLDSSGRWLVGTSSAFDSAYTGTNGLAYIEKSSTFSSLGVKTNSADTNGAYITLGKARGGTANSKTIVNNGDEIGGIYFEGADGAAMRVGANISAYVDGTPGASDLPTRLVFSTTADGASSPTERMRLINSGFLKVSNDGSYQSTTSGNHEFTNTLDTDSLIVRSTNASYSGNGILALATRNTTNNSFYAFSYYNSGASAYRFRIADSGNATNTNNSYGAISDAKLKENIVDATSQWSDIKALQVRKYNFKEETGQPTHTQIGLIAQEVELVSPGLVSESPDRDEEGNDLGTVTKSVNYSVLYMKAVKALQEAMKRIEQLETSNADLLARVTALETA